MENLFGLLFLIVIVYGIYRFFFCGLGNDDSEFKENPDAPVGSCDHYCSPHAQAQCNRLGPSGECPKDKVQS